MFCGKSNVPNYVLYKSCFVKSSTPIAPIIINLAIITFFVHLDVPMFNIQTYTGILSENRRELGENSKVFQIS